MPIDIRSLPDNHPLQSLYLRVLYQESQKEMEILFDNKGGNAMDRSMLIEELISENMRYKQALEHICEVEMDSAEFEKEMMFNIARDALKGVK